MRFYASHLKYNVLDTSFALIVRNVLFHAQESLPVKIQSITIIHWQNNHNGQTLCMLRFGGKDKWQNLFLCLPETLPWTQQIITNASTAELMGDFITVQCKLWKKESAECHKTTTKSEKSRTTTHVNLGLRNVEMSLEIVKNTMSPQKSRAYICKLAMMLVCLTAKSTKHEHTRFLLENVTECPNSGKMENHETGFFHVLSPSYSPLSSAFL